VRHIVATQHIEKDYLDTRCSYAFLECSKHITPQHIEKDYLDTRCSN